MNSLLHISSVNEGDKCNYIKPDSLSKFYSINPETGKQFADKDRNILLRNYKRVSNVKSGKVKRCCSRAHTFETGASQDYVAKIKKIYPMVKLSNRLSEVVSIELSKNPNTRGAGWEPITPYVICKLADAVIKPTNDPEIMIATHLTSNCFIDNCDNVDTDITLGTILNVSQQDLKYTYFDDAKAVEAVRDNEINNVKNYIRKYKDVDQPLSHDDRNNRLIHLAAQYNRTDIADLLIAVKADINIGNKDGDTPLHITASHANLDVMSSLLKHGADVKIRNNKKETVIFHAIKNGDIRGIRLLYNNGADIYSADYEGNVPVVYAIKYSPNKKEIVEFLLERGSPNNPDKDGNNALDLIKEQIAKEQSNNSNNNINTNINNKVEGFKVKEIKETDISEKVQDLKSTATLIRNTTFSYKHGVEDMLKGSYPGDYYPVELINKECVGNQNVNGDETKEECEKKGGRMVTITEPSTRIIVSYDGKGESDIDKIKESDLYYPKHYDSRLEQSLPNSIRELNKKAKTGEPVNDKKNDQVESEDDHPHVISEDDNDVIKNVKEALENTAKIDKKIVEGFQSQCSLDSDKIVIYSVGIAVLLLTVMYLLQKK